MTVYRTFGAFKGEQAEVSASVVAMNRAEFARRKVERLKGELREVLRRERTESNRAEITRLSAEVRRLKSELA